MSRHPSAVFIGATGQNIGKTTLCLGMLAALLKRYEKVGFIKPVGQQHVLVEEGISVDKDVLLFKNLFSLPEAWRDMSPVIIPPGFTRSYLDGEVSQEGLLCDIQKSFFAVAGQNPFTLVEGTGHIGVGSIIGLSNARVARALGLDMIIIASGGLGSSYDELCLNLALCEREGVRVRGVILNRVHAEKQAMIENYYTKALTAWGVPLMGSIPFNLFLNSPTMSDFEVLFKSPLLSGEENRYRHCRNFRLVAGSLEAYIEEFVEDDLLITPASRSDIIDYALKHSRGGIILTGRTTLPEPLQLKIVSSQIPTLVAPLCSFDAMKQINTYVAKIQREDTQKVQRAIDLIENHVDFSYLLEEKGVAVQPS